MIHKLEQKLEFLSSLDQDNLETWLLTYLSEGYSYPVIFDESKEPGFYQLVEICRLGDVRFSNRFRTCLARLLIDWNHEDHSLQYLDTLLFLIGRLRVTKVQAYLMQLAEQEIERDDVTSRFKGRSLSSSNENKEYDIFREIIRTIAALGPVGRDMLTLFSEMITSDPTGNYSDLCYRILWESDRLQGIAHLYNMLRLFFTNPLKRLSTSVAVCRFIMNNTLLFLDNIDHVFEFMRTNFPSGMKDLYIILVSSGIQCDILNDEALCYAGRHDIKTLTSDDAKEMLVTFKMAEVTRTLSCIATKGW